MKTKILILLFFLVTIPLSAVAGDRYLDGVNQDGGGGTAAGTTADTTNFDNNLSAADDTVQKALETLDETTGSANAITAAAVITDHSIIRGDGGSRGAQDSGVLIDDSDNMTGVNSASLTPITAPSHSEGLIFYDSVTKGFVAYNNEADFSWNIGRELVLRVYNDTGVTILDGKVCYLSGVFGVDPTVALAQANSAATSLATLGIATHDIEDGTYGEITIVGTVHSYDTSGFTSGDPLFLSATVAGDTVNVAPTSPNYLIIMGQAGVINALTGTIEVNVDIGTNTGGVIQIFNGAVFEDTTTSVSSNGTVVTLSYEQNGGGDLSLFFNGGFSAFDATPAATIALTPGSDSAPTLNYVFIPESTMVLTVNTSGFPTAQHVPVATILVQSAAGSQTDGVFKLHAWTDHLSDSNSQGHLSHINSRIRRQHAEYFTGVAPTTSITVNGGAIDNVYFSNTSGFVTQVHDQPFPALDMATTAPIWAINDDTTPFRRVTDLSTLDEDSTGASLRSNNTYYSIVVFGVASEAGTDSKLYCNLSSGFYITETGANNDANQYSNFNIPDDLKGTGFLIARIVLRYQTADSGTITLVQTINLRGLLPSTAAGGGGVSGGTEFSDNLFRVQNVGDVTKQIALDASGITTGNTKTITMPDADVDLGDVNTAVQPGDIATTSAAGVVELATGVETVTGTDTTRAVTPDGLTDRMGATGGIGGTTPAPGAFTTLSSTLGLSTPGNSIGPQVIFMLEDTDNGTTYIGIAVQADNGNDLVWAYPKVDPTAGQVMVWAEPVSVTYSDNVTRDTTIGSWSALSGGGDALQASPLSQFAATTSAQFAGVISNETGTGLVVLATSPALTTPDLGTPSAIDLSNATGFPLSLISGTSSLATASISSGACAATVITTATGAATTDAISYNFNSDPTAVTGYAPSTDGGLFVYAWPTTNNVNFSVCNNTASAITPGARTINWSIIK